MDSTDVIYNGIKEAGINFIVSVPCANLKKLLELIDEDEEITHVPVTREEEGFGICAGAYMGGMKVAILMQNSGLGNSVNVLTSLFKLYDFPILMIISHRGTFGEGICGQVPMNNISYSWIYFNHSKMELKKEWHMNMEPAYLMKIERLC